MKRISAARVARLIAGWQAGDKTLAERLSSALGRVIAARELPVGVLMPSERALATTLAISRGTVGTAYDLLCQNQWLCSQRGSGYRVIASSNSPGQVHIRLIGEVPAAPQDLDMSSGALPSSPLLIDMLKELQGSELASRISGLGYDAYGLPELRSAIARHYCEQGLATEPGQILITSGAQQAVWLLANALVDASDLVLLENPSYRGSLEVFRRRNARLAGVAATRRGLDWEAFDALLQQQPRLLYLFPACHNPTGRTMDESSRQRIAAQLKQHHGFLVEDGAQSELFLYGARPPLPLAALCDPERVATVGTFSKLFWGGMRVGWIRASRNVVFRLASMKAVNDLGSSFFDQYIALKLLERLPEARALRNQEISAALKTAERLLREQGDPAWEWDTPTGGTALWIRIPGADAVAMCQALAKQGVILSAGPAYSVSEDFSDYIRLPFVRSQADIEHTIGLVTAQLRRSAGARPNRRGDREPPQDSSLKPVD